MILKFINQNSKHKILSYSKITLPQLLNFHYQILSLKFQTPISLSKKKKKKKSFASSGQ